MLATFRCCRYRFILQATTPVHLSAFAGSTLRGGFGHVFKRTVCVWPPGDCGRCLLKDRCAYPYIFETAPPPDAEKLRGLEQLPRPFVLEPPERGGKQSYRPGERFDFGLVLVGRGIGYLPYFVLAFGELGRTGLGAGHGHFDVIEVLAEHPSATQRIWSAGTAGLSDADAMVTASELARPPILAKKSELPKRLVLHFLTPARVRSEGRVRSALTFQELVRALLRRLSSLCYFHCDCELKVDFKGLIEGALVFRTVEDSSRWQEQGRFSGRQRQSIDMSGVLGRVVFEAPEASAWEPYLPLLAAGEWVHVGKGTVMGLGKYRVETE
jgi:hypothetical protein